MSTKPAFTEGHISSRQEATSGQVMRVAVICAFLAGAALLALALLVAVGRGAVAQTEPETMNVACESKSTGQMRYVESASECNLKKETSLTWSAEKPIFACASTRSGSPVRHVLESGQCSSRETELTLPDEESEVYFCAANRNGALRYVDDPSTCGSRETAVVVPVANNAPVADPQSVSTAEDTVTNITLTASDQDPGDTLTYDIASGPTHGSLSGTAPNVTYTPDADYNGPDEFTFTANDGKVNSDPATVSITVSAVNDTPEAVDDGSETEPAATTDEDVATGQIDVLANDTGLGDTPITVTIETQGAKGTAEVNSDNTITYTPEADANGSDSFVYEVCDGDSTPECDTATVHVAITAANDTPDAIDDGSETEPAATVNEDSTTGATVDVLANDTGLGDTPITVSIDSQGAKGTATVNADNSVTYVPDADEDGPDSFVYEVCDGDSTPECDTATVSIAIDAVNDAPVNTVPAGPLAAVQDTDTPISGISIADVDAGSGAVEVTLSVTDGTLTLKTDVSDGLGAGDVSGSGTESVIATGTLAQINATLADANGLVYHSDATFTGTDTLTVTTDDQGNTGSGGPQTDTDTLTINVEPPNEPPTAAGQSVDADEDTAETITLAADDPDGDAVTSFSITDPPDHGTLGSIGSITCDSLTPNHCTADVSYTPEDDYNGPDSFQFTASDAQATSSAVTVNITVAPVNDVPVLADIEGDALAYTENDAATVVTSTTTVADVDSANFDTGTLTVDLSANGSADDRLEIRNEGTGAGQIGLSGSNVTYGGTTIGSFSGGSGTTPLVVTLNDNATAEATQALVHNITYRNVSEDPSSATRTVRFVLTDGDGGTSAPATRDVSVTAVNDAPALTTTAGALSYTENDTPKVIDSGATASDPDSADFDTGKLTVDYTAGGTADDRLAINNEGTGPGQIGVSGSNVTFGGTTIGTFSGGSGTTALEITFNANSSPAAAQALMRNITYANVSDNPATAARTVRFVLTDGDGGTSNAATKQIDVTAVNDLPVADPETFDGANGAIGNTTLVGNDPSDGAPTVNGPKKSISADILDGDTDIDGPGPLEVVAGTFPTNDGGSVTIEADGDFTFTPAAGTSCTDVSDSFNYTLTDNNPGTAGTATGTVTISISGCVWYVSNNHTGPPDNLGTSNAPFNTLAQAETASGANHTVFVFDGDNTSTGYGGDGYAMNAGERLIGEHEGLVVGSDTLFPANPGAKPTLTATNADVIDLDDGNEVRGFVLDPQGTGGGIAGSTGDTGGGTIDDVDVTDTGTAGTQPGLELDSTTGTFSVSNLVVNNFATGVRLHNTTTPANAVNAVFDPASQISLTSNGGPGLDVDGTAAVPVNLGTSTFDDITVTNSGTGGANITNATGTTTFGDGLGTDLALTTTSGATPAFSLSNAGSPPLSSVTVPSGGIANASATGGPAIDVTGTSGATLNFDDVDSTNSANDGINIDGLGAGTFTADTNSTIAGAAGIAFDLNGGSGTVDFNGTINNGQGSTAEITGRSGGTVALSGSIAESGDADTTQENGGLALTGNTGGSTVVSNAAKSFNTGEDHAIVMGTSDGHTLTFSGGGLDIDTTSGAGFSATGGGTIVVGTGANPNTIDSTTGTALNVANTTIGASGLTFKSISANGAASGIVLNNTGTGSLTVTGNVNTSQGGDNSGGTIQNTTGHGISLTNTTSPSFTNVRLLNTGNSGVNGTQVSGFTFRNGTITGAGDASDENSITFDDSLTATPNLTGVVTITDNVISQTEAEGVDIENWGGTISDANISGNALSDTGDVATPGSAITLIGSGLPNSAANITKATVANNTITDFRAGVGVQVRAGNPNALPAPTGSAGTAGSATNVIAVTGNSMNGGNAGIGNQPDRFFTGGVSGNGGQGNFNVSNNGTAANRIQHIDCIAIEMQMDGPVTMTSTVQNNFINANSAVGCAGIAVGTDDPSDLGAGTHTTTISGNNVMGTDGPGIFPIVRDSGSTMTAKVLNNTVAAPITTNAARAGIRVDSGSAQGDTTMCLEISGNTTAGSTNSGTSTTSPGINLRKQLPDPTVNTFGIEGLSPSPTGTPNVENWVNSQNTSTSGTFGVGGTALLSATQGFTSCNAP